MNFGLVVASLETWLGGLDEQLVRLLVALFVGGSAGLLGGCVIRGARWAAHGRCRLRPPGCPDCGAALLGSQERSVPDRCSECGMSGLRLEDPRLRWVERGTRVSSALVTTPLLLVGGTILIVETARWSLRSFPAAREAWRREVTLATRTEFGETAQRQRDALSNPNEPLPSIEEFCAVRGEKDAWAGALPGDAEWIRSLLGGTQTLPPADRHPYVIEMLSSAVRLELVSDEESATILARCAAPMSLLPPAPAISGEPLRWAALVGLPRCLHVGLIATEIRLDGQLVANSTQDVTAMGMFFVGEDIPAHLEPGPHRLSSRLVLMTQNAGTPRLIGSVLAEAPFDVRLPDDPWPSPTWDPFVGRNADDHPGATLVRVSSPHAEHELCQLHLMSRAGSTISGTLELRGLDGWRPIARLRRRTSTESVSWIEDGPPAASEWGDAVEFRIRPEQPGDAALPICQGQPARGGGEDWWGELTFIVRRSASPSPTLRSWTLNGTLNTSGG
jgi:hypothetical protein